MKKLIASMTCVLAFVSVLCLVFTSIMLHSQQSVQANVSFNGIDSIIAANSAENQYKIVELVPDAGMAEIGYMIGGEEPEQWIINLQSMNNSVNRVAYMKGLEEKLKAIIAQDASKPITYKSYKEEYAVENKNEWNSLQLSSDEILPQGTAGYTMEEASDGDFDYSYTYSLNQDGKGEYNQNVDHYAPKMGGYYAVSFKEADADKVFIETQKENGDIETVVKEGIKLYEPYATTAITSFEDMENMKLQSSPQTYIYRLPLSNMGGAYEYYDKLGDLNSFEDLEDIEEYLYFSVQFKYVEPKEAIYGEIYYVSDNVEFMTDSSGEYGAVLDIDNPYISVEDGENGYFNRESDDCYIYVGEGKGSHKIKKDDAKSLDFDVYIRKIYYKGGFENNNWFVKGVFDQTNSLKKDLYCDIWTVTPMWPEESRESAYSGMDLLYIASNSSVNGKLNEFSKDNDISWEEVCTIIRQVKSSRSMPIILDYSIIKDVTINKYMTNIQKLAAILCSVGVQELEFDETMKESDEFWKNIANSQIKDADNHFVNTCVYVFPGNDYKEQDKVSPFLFSDFMSDFVNSSGNDDSFLAAAAKLGFGEIAQNIIDENLNRRTENAASDDDSFDYFDLTISKAIAIEYIIGYSSKQEQKQEGKLKVLDIEPCYVTDTTTGALKVSDIQNWFGSSYSVEIESITHISTAEFIGKIYDLKNFDLIYFGKNINKMNQKNGVTQYNDADMNGLIYSNIGDIAVANENHSGMLDSDYKVDGTSKRIGIVAEFDDALISRVSVANYQKANNTYRYSGNDITKEKVNAITDYVKAGFPVIIEDTFVSTDKNGKQNINEDYVDNCSYIYSLFKNIIDSNNVDTVSGVKKNAKKMFNYLELGHPVVSAMDKTTVSEDNYVTITNHIFSEVFSISNPSAANANATFNCILYIDSNSDGKFSLTQEGISPTDIKMYDNGTLIKPVFDEGNNQYYFELIAGATHTYQITYSLPDSYVGLIPWKIEISQSDNRYRTDSMQGYVYLPKTGEKELIHILQITQSSKPKSSNYLSNFNMQQQYANKGSKFAQLIDRLDDFKLEIETVNSDVFDAQYKTKYKERIETDENSTPYYDMLVMGFADMYEILDTGSGCVDGIKEYINMGYPVLFTHDTTSFYNDSTKPTKWGYDFNSKIRNMVGMDRYGILASSTLKKGKQLVKDSRDTGDMYKTVIEESKRNQLDVAYKPRSNKQIIVKQSQGFATADLAQYAAQKGGNYNKYYYLSGISSTSLTTTTSVEQINTGQITTYPYKLGKNLNVATTHSQYYQLDLNEDADNDGESDIVVWYTLKGSSQALGASPRDIRNNYYIYTKGNVTYSGVGHNGSLTEDELKLYINTMIAAYSSARRPPVIRLAESDSDDAANINTIYVSYDDVLKKKDDSMEKTGEIDKGIDSIEQTLANDKKTVACENVYMTVTDTNLVTNLNSKYEVVEFGVPVTEAEYNMGNKNDFLAVTDGNGDTLYLKKVDISIYKGKNRHEFNLLSSGVTYRVEIPLKLMPAQSDYCDVYVVAYTKIVRNSADGSSKTYTIKTPSSFNKIRLQKIGLTDLD